MNSSKRRGVMISIVVILLGIGYLVFGEFGKNLVYFFTPSEVISLPRDYPKKIRVAGMVGGLRTLPDSLKIDFTLTDGQATLTVHYEGILPDLFKEGQGAVVEGHWKNSIFHATMIMAKHSEDYMPPEMRALGQSLPKKDLLKTLQN